MRATIDKDVARTLATIRALTRPGICNRLIAIVLGAPIWVPGVLIDAFWKELKE